MRLLVMVLVLVLSTNALAKDRYRGVALLWDSANERYRELTVEEARFFNLAKDMFKARQGAPKASPSPSPTPKPKIKRRGKRDFDGTDEELGSKLDIAPDTESDGTPKPPEKAGEVKASADFKAEIDTFAAYLAHSERIKVGPSLALRLADNWKASLDVADQFLGASLNYDFTHLLRPSLGAGVGTELDGTWQAYGKASFRIW